MDNMLKSIIGQRVKKARKEIDMNQQQLAQAVGIKEHQTISSIELGERNVSASELVKFMDVLNKDIDFFTDPYLITDNNVFCWRLSNSHLNNTDEEKAKSLISLFRLISDLNNSSEPTLDFKLRASILMSYPEAEKAAKGLSQILQLGEVPALSLVEKIESELRIPVIYTDMSEEVSGAAYNSSDFRCIIINYNEVEWRRNFDIAHELFHILTWDVFPPKETESVKSKNKQKPEKLADYFASVLLLPEDQVCDYWGKHDKEQNTKDKLVNLAIYFKVSPIAAFWRLKNLKIIHNEINEREIPNLPATSSCRPEPLNYLYAKNLNQSIRAGKISLNKVLKSMFCSEAYIHKLMAGYGLPDIYSE